jgi:NADH:ubiquinone oxidoreductase subunit E
MTEARQRRIARIGARSAVVLIVLCIIVLTISYVVGRIAKPRDDERILALQEQVTQDASIAPELEAEHARITSERRGRKALGDTFAIVLIVASGVFIGCVKWQQSFEPRRPVPMEQLVQVTAAPAPGGQSARRKRTDVAEPDDTDLSFVDEVVAKFGTNAEAAVGILQAIQNHYRYLPDAALQRVCELTEITPAQIAGTSSFYAQFRRSPVGKHVVRVCHGTACHVAGARQITEELRRRLSIPEGEDTDADRMFTVDEVACLGCCSLAPVMMVDDQTAGKLTPSAAYATLETIEPKEPA